MCLKQRIGEEITEQLDIIPAQLKVIQHVRPNLGCMAHARRPFAELVKLAKKTGKSHQAVAYFQKLYVIEKIAREGKYTPQ